MEWLTKEKAFKKWHNFTQSTCKRLFYRVEFIAGSLLNFGPYCMALARNLTRAIVVRGKRFTPPMPPYCM